MTSVNDYAFGRSDHETDRLLLQAEILRPHTERLLRTAGIAPGMRILDLGCGTGDVAVLAAGLVGHHGQVVGVDHDQNLLTLASHRAQAAGATNIEFRPGNVEAFNDPDGFDIVTGRCIAFFATDPADLFRTAARAVRPNGVLALQEPHAPWVPLPPDLTRHGQFSAPRITDIERVGEAFTRALAAAAPSHDVAPRMAEHFARAGLPSPDMSWSVLVAAGGGSPLLDLMAACFHSIHPQLDEHGIDGFDDLATDTLAQHLHHLATRHPGQISFYALVSAWTRL